MAKIAPPESVSNYSKEVIWSIVIVSLLMAGMMISSEIALRRSEERPIVENILRNSGEITKYFLYVFDVKALRNPLHFKGPRDYAWQVNANEGFFTFEVRGYESRSDLLRNRLKRRYFRVHFSKSEATLNLIHIKANAGMSYRP